MEKKHILMDCRRYIQAYPLNCSFDAVYAMKKSMKNEIENLMNEFGKGHPLPIVDIRS